MKDNEPPQPRIDPVGDYNRGIFIKKEVVVSKSYLTYELKKPTVCEK